MGVAPVRTLLACEAGAIAAADRQAHFALLTRLFTELAVERQTIANGYAYSFESSAFEGVVRFVMNERKCCPFLTFLIHVEPRNGPIWLRIEGPEGVREFLDAELPPPR